MNKWFVILSAVIAAGLTACACNPQAAPPATPTTVPSETAAPDGAVIRSGLNPQFGEILVDGNGLTLYVYTEDTPDTSACYGQCPDFWPPMIAEGAVSAGDGVDASILSTTTRQDGSLQVTYNGRPLYSFYLDFKPGDVKGQGFQDVWYVISPAGEMIIE